MKEFTMSEDNGPCDATEWKIDLFYCSKKQHFLYPPISEHKGNWIETYDEENNPMPRKCAHYFSDLIEDMINREVRDISKKELEDFKLVASDNIELGEAIFLGFMERKENLRALPF